RNGSIAESSQLHGQTDSASTTPCQRYWLRLPDQRMSWHHAVGKSRTGIRAARSPPARLSCGSQRGPVRSDRNQTIAALISSSQAGESADAGVRGSIRVTGALHDI